MNTKREAENRPVSTRLHWAGMHEFSFLAGMRFMFWISRAFGRWPFRLILYPVLVWYVANKSAARHASQDYLKHVSRIRPVSAGMLNVLRHFAAFAEMMLDKMLVWNGLINVDSVRFTGTELIQQQLAEKRGAVLICSHFGNLDLCRVMSGYHSGLKLTVLVHTKHAQEFNQMLEAINPNSQLNLMQVTDITPATAMLLAERVDRGEFVVIAGDRIPVSVRPRVVQTEFLGASAPFPVGPYILASVLQCPIYMIFSMRCKDSHEIHFSLLRKEVRIGRREREQVLTELVTDYVQQLEQHCLSEPLQWFNFYDFWYLSEWNKTNATR